ncbi:YraL family S-adenosylmethionine-dependent methyltransferase [Enterococcus termitis]|nr:YraL family S-adenosylmethionine-dependent methyltransferase [Enterococcus termitis]
MIERNQILETENELVLYARNAAKRITPLDSEREQTVDGDFSNRSSLTKAMQGVEAVYLNDMGDPKAITTILEIMEETGVKRIISATVLGIYDEVSGAFGRWNQQMLGNSRRYQDQKDSAKLIEESGVDYTLLRLTWLYNEQGNEDYAYTLKGEPFVGAEVTRQAVARLVSDILAAKDNQFSNQSLGVYEPGSEKLAKPSFY